MKKLIVAIAAVAMAIGAQAASVSWASGEMVLSDGVTDAAKDDITMYIWEVSSSVYSTYSGITDMSALSQSIMEDYASLTASATVTKNTANSGKATIVGADNKSAGNTVYAVILFTDNTAADPTYMGNVYTGTVPDVGNLVTASLGLKKGGTGAATAWYTESVPEPTSGLLLLLGVAGLALRRRRA